MTVQERYEAARKMYADVGVDTDAAIAKLKEIPLGRLMYCIKFMLFKKPGAFEIPASLPNADSSAAHRRT